MARVLFDQGTPVGLRRHLRAHLIETLAAKGWEEKENGELLDLADAEGYEVLVTTDRNIRHQQNLTRRKLAVVVLVNARWPDVASHATAIATAIEEAEPGRLTEVQCAGAPTRQKPTTLREVHAPRVPGVEAAARRIPTPRERAAAAAQEIDPDGKPGQGRDDQAPSALGHPP